MRRQERSLIVFLCLVFAGACLLCAGSSEAENAKLASISFHRPVNPILGTRRALIMMVSHQSLKPSAFDRAKMQQVMNEVKEIFAVASNRTFSLEAVVLPEPVLLPGECSDYSLKKIRDLHAVANQEVVKKYGNEMDPNKFDAVVYFFPTDTNAEPFGMTRWNSAFGFRYKPAVVNMGPGEAVRPEAIAHEMGHALFLYGHATSANPQTGEVLRWAGDPYEVMGYGLNRNLINPPHLGMAYRHYWGWTSTEEITAVAEPGTFRLDPGRALLLTTEKDSVLWLEVIRAEQAYGEETGGLLVRVDRSDEKGIYHSTLDMTPETEFKADLHVKPGQSMVFEGRTITYVKSIENEKSKTPSAEIKIEGSGPWH